VGAALRTLVQEFALELFGGHLIIHYESAALLLATGSRVSVGNRSPYRFLGEDLPVEPRYNGLTTGQLSGAASRAVELRLEARPAPARRLAPPVQYAPQVLPTA